MEKRNKWTIIVIIAIMIFAFGGCSGVELEDRNFPLAVTLDADESGYQVMFQVQDLSKISDENVDDTQSEPLAQKAASWYEAFAVSNEDNPKTVDYNHVKVLIVGRQVLDDKEILSDLLTYLKKQQIISRNTYLYVGENQAADILELDENIELSIGTYLQEMTQGMDDLDDRGIVTVGDLMNQLENRNENLFIPVLSEKDDNVVISAYYTLSSFSSCGDIDDETFQIAMLLENKLDQYSVILDSGEAVELKKPRCTYEMIPDNNQCLEKITIKSEAIVSNDILDDQDRQEIEDHVNGFLQKKIQVYAEYVKEELGFDISNSYYRLGGYNREMYKMYNQKQISYLNHLCFEIICDIDLVAN